jgi:hypothetical protein
MPAQPGSQPAADRSMGRRASRPGSCAAAQPGRQATFGLASEQPAGRWACPLARRAARQLPARGQPVPTPENTRFFFYTGIRHFSETVIKNSQTPEKKKFGKRPASQLVGRHVSHSSQPAPTGSPASSCPVSQQANWTTVQARGRPTGWPGNGHRTSRPAVFSILSLLGSAGGGVCFFFFIWPETPETH